jgi:hypothetical protein
LSHLEAWQVALIAAPFFVLLVWVRNIKYFSMTSLLSNICVVVAVSAILEYGFDKKGIHSDQKLINSQNLPIFYGIVAFGYAIHGLVFFFFLSTVSFFLPSFLSLSE